MSTLTTIQSTDLITNSRADINDNFAALNADKLETSVLDTDTTLSADSDAKVPTQKAVKAYVDAGGNVNASTTAKGIVEEATATEVAAGTATGGTGARLFVNPSTMPQQALTLVPYPNGGLHTTTSKTITGNTTAFVGQISIPYYITVNKVTLRNAGGATSGTLNLALFSEDGQTRLFSVTTASIAPADTIVSTSVGAVFLRPGIYYFYVNPNSTASLDMYVWSQSAAPFSTTGGLLGDVSSEPKLSGTYTITADTVPSTLTLASITEADNPLVICRLDN
jgi:hypothetical protein